jgi:hypothetical protein
VCLQIVVGHDLSERVEETRLVASSLPPVEQEEEEGWGEAMGKGGDEVG